MVDFVNEIEKQLALIIKDEEKKVTQEFKKAAEDVYDYILSPGISPVWSGYYKSNHRIMITNAKGQFKTGGVKLFPTQKPEFPEVLTYVDNIADTRSKELNKLNKLELGDTVRITTSVPYADEVETKHQVYASAAAIFRAS